MFKLNDDINFIIRDFRKTSNTINRKRNRSDIIKEYMSTLKLSSENNYEKIIIKIHFENFRAATRRKL